VTKTISELLLEQVEALRRQAGLVSVRLNDPSDEALEAIVAAGGQLAERGFDRWCHTDTCHHNSHAEGQAWQTVIVPSTYVEQARGATHEIWQYEGGTDAEPVLFLPRGPALILDVRQGRHFASHSKLVRLRPEAQNALAGVLPESKAPAQ
jgi:hypothetical protein